MMVQNSIPDWSVLGIRLPFEQWKHPDYWDDPMPPLSLSECIEDLYLLDNFK
jgi:hypothetical protein